jgi:hypothetical protein
MKTITISILFFLASCASQTSLNKRSCQGANIKAGVKLYGAYKEPKTNTELKDYLGIKVFVEKEAFITSADFKSVTELDSNHPFVKKAYSIELSENAKKVLAKKTLDLVGHYVAFESNGVPLSLPLVMEQIESATVVTPARSTDYDMEFSRFCNM